MTPSKHFYFPKSRALKTRELPQVYRILRKAQGHRHWWPAESPFEVMVGAILTQNTAWTNVEKAIRNLKEAGKLNLSALLNIPQKRLASLIRPAGYFNVKANRLKHFVRFLEAEFRGNIGRMKRMKTGVLRAKLLNVKGIGPETADSILLYAVGKPSFVIDAYTKRIFARHRLHDLHASYEAWQAIFRDNLPCNVGIYNDFHAQIVEIGKNHCRNKPRCEDCPLQTLL